MNKYVKRAILTATIMIVVLIVIISTFFIVRYVENKNKINTVMEIYSNSIIQDRIQDNDENAIINVKDALLQIDGEMALGIITIDKIKYKGIVYEGTETTTLAKGVGHFEHSPYLIGNVCIAGHNYISVWDKLYTLRPGDNITYISFLGTKTYQVSSIQEINETDWDMLQDTEDNRITLITCVNSKPNKRLCVQGIER